MSEISHHIEFVIEPKYYESSATCRSFIRASRN